LCQRGVARAVLPNFGLHVLIVGLELFDLFGAGVGLRLSVRAAKQSDLLFDFLVESLLQIALAVKQCRVYAFA
jgi:hypothetical protein